MDDYHASNERRNRGGVPDASYNTSGQGMPPDAGIPVIETSGSRRSRGLGGVNDSLGSSGGEKASQQMIKSRSALNTADPFNTGSRANKIPRPPLPSHGNQIHDDDSNSAFNARKPGYGGDYTDDDVSEARSGRFMQDPKMARN
jgi:hypothetical protein